MDSIPSVIIMEGLFSMNYTSKNNLQTLQVYLLMYRKTTRKKDLLMQ